MKELARLETLRGQYGSQEAAEKLALLRALDRQRLASASRVERLHEALCFLRAYPDDAALLSQVETMLAGFARRPDLKRQASKMVGTGIAGTAIEMRFYWFTALWLARRCPDELTIDWQILDCAELLDRRLTRLLTFPETLGLEEVGLGLREWIERLRGDAPEAAFLLERFAALKLDSFLRESYFEELDIPFRVSGGDRSPSRTRARYAKSPVVFQTSAPDRSRGAFRPALEHALSSIRPVAPREARTLIDMAREAMVVRDRDLDCFVHADLKDVRMADCGGGLQFACYGTSPERRQMLDSAYGFLTLRNGVPTGYVLSASLLGSTEIAYNVFETYRGTEAAHTFGRAIATVRRLFGSDTFVLDPYQLGHGNAEGLESGAWWFYYKLGFRPKDPEVQALVRDELRRMKKNPRHRSSIPTLERLSAAEMFLHLGKPRDDVIGIFERGRVGLAITDYLARRFGAARERGLRICVAEAAGALGVRSFSGWSADERRAWERWSPIVLLLPGLERWPRADKLAFARVIRAKGGRRESDFVQRFDGHRRLRRAIVELSRTTE